MILFYVSCKVQKGGIIMASNNGRETYNLGETKKATKPKEVKTNLNLNKETNWGSGEYDDVYGGHNYGYRKRRSFPDIEQ